MEISPSDYPEETQRCIRLAQAAAQKEGFAFPLPATVEQLSQPFTHYRVMADEENGMQTCVLLDPRGGFLNVESRPVVVPPKKSLWRRLFGG